MGNIELHIAQIFIHKRYFESRVFLSLLKNKYRKLWKKSLWTEKDLLAAYTILPHHGSKILYIHGYGKLEWIQILIQSTCTTLMRVDLVPNTFTPCIISCWYGSSSSKFVPFVDFLAIFVISV